jgi:K(+)-stimulated pyrophosphate-energized sodium pump
MNPVIKFTTLFGLFAVELAEAAFKDNSAARQGIAAVLFTLMCVFVYRSFYGMRIESKIKSA